jgi:hypothetical protein
VHPKVPAWFGRRPHGKGLAHHLAPRRAAHPGNAPLKRNRFIQLSGGTKTVNREMKEKARTLAGVKGYITNLAACPDGTPVTAEVSVGNVVVELIHLVAPTALPQAYGLEVGRSRRVTAGQSAVRRPGRASGG